MTESVDGLTRLELHELIPTRWNPNAVFQGVVISTRAYAPTTRLATIMLAPLQTTQNAVQALLQEVQLKGPWVEDFMQSVHAGDKLILKVMKAKLEHYKPTSALSNAPSSRNDYKILFDKEIKGWFYDKEGGVTEFHFGGGKYNCFRLQTVYLIRAFLLLGGSKLKVAKNSAPIRSMFDSPSPESAVNGSITYVDMCPVSIWENTMGQPLRQKVAIHDSNEIQKEEPPGKALIPNAVQEVKEEIAAINSVHPPTVPRSPNPSILPSLHTRARPTRKQRKEEVERDPIEKAHAIRKLTASDCGLKTAKRYYYKFSEIPRPTTGSGTSAISVMGVVLDPGQRQITRSGDHMINIRLHDPSVDNWESIGLFADPSTPFPVCEVGDIALFQTVHRAEKRNQLTGFKKKFNGLPPAYWAVFKPADLLGSNSKHPKPRECADYPEAAYSYAEINYARDLATWNSSTNKAKVKQTREILERLKNPLLPTSIISESVHRSYSTGDKPVVPAFPAIPVAMARRRRPFQQIKDLLEFNKFFDCIAEVVTVNVARYGTATAEIEVTDYTVNPLLCSPETRMAHWDAPVGRRVLLVQLYSVIGDFALQKLKRGQLIYLENVRAKKDGQGNLEANMFPDKDNFKPKMPITIFFRDDPACPLKYLSPQFEELKGRREEYWASLHQKLVQGDVLIEHQTVDVQEATVVPARAFQVHCGLASHPVHSMSLPLQDQRSGYYRLRGRIVDYYPPRLQDWIVAQCPLCLDILPVSCRVCMEHSQVKLYFRFAFAIEDGSSIERAPKRMMVQVDGDDPHGVLPGVDPTQSMREGGAELDSLRERLKSIIGDLEVCKKRKMPAYEEHAGRYFDFAVFGAYDIEGNRTFRFQSTSLR